jgi:hypothetical protein
VIAVDEVAGAHGFLSFRLDLQQLQHGPLAAADKELFIANAEFTGAKV